MFTHKCPHGYSPTSLIYLFTSRSVSTRYSLRVMMIHWLLQTATNLNFASYVSMFSYASPKVWNALPVFLREIETMSLFKNPLKAYFLIQCLRMLPLLHASILQLNTANYFCCVLRLFLLRFFFECCYGPVFRCIDTSWCYLKGDINCLLLLLKPILSRISLGQKMFRF